MHFLSLDSQRHKIPSSHVPTRLPVTAKEEKESVHDSTVHFTGAQSSAKKTVPYNFFSLTQQEVPLQHR